MDILKQVKVRDLDRVYAQGHSCAITGVSSRYCTEGESSLATEENDAIISETGSTTRSRSNSPVSTTHISSATVSQANTSSCTNNDNDDDDFTLSIGLPLDPVKEEIVSTAFRIQGQGEDNSTSPSSCTLSGENQECHENAPKTEEQVEDIDADTDVGAYADADVDTGGETIQTTLHFKSGLSLPISTRSESDKILAQATKKDRHASSNTTPSKSSTSSSQTAKETTFQSNSNEVDQQVSFGALKGIQVQVPVKNDSSSLSEEKKKNAQRITDAKQSAARAMLASSNHASTVRLLKNLRFAFPTAIDFHNANAQKPSTSTYEESICLTIDPSYLSEQSGMQFLNDVENIVDFELRKLKSSHANTNMNTSTRKSANIVKCKYLSDDFRIQVGDENPRSVPQWLIPYLHSPDSDVPLVLILLARIEQSIMQQKKSNKSTNDNSASGAALTPQANDAPLNELKSDPKIESSNPSTETDVKIQVPLCLKSTRMQLTSNQSFLSDIFVSYKRLKEQKKLTNIVTLSPPLGKSLRVQDILFVPVEQALSASKFSHAVDQENLKNFISKWNNIIDTAHQIVHSTEKIDNSLSKSDHEVVKLFADEVLTSKKKKKKKKKKKTKKVCFLLMLECLQYGTLIDKISFLNLCSISQSQKRKADANKTSNNENAAITKSQEIEETNEVDPPKVVESQEITKVASEGVADECAAVTVSIISITSENSQKNENEEILKSTKPQKKKTAQPIDNAPTSKDEIRNGEEDGKASTGNAKDQENNDEGWETVEPKKGKKVSSTIKSHVDKAGQGSTQNSSRKNKGKARARNRNRQKDKEQAKANLDSHEVDIAKRGANTTKALMEERNKRQASTPIKKKISSGHGIDSKLAKRTMHTKNSLVGNLSSAASRFQSEETLKIGSGNSKIKPSDPKINEKFERKQQKRSLVADQNTASTLQETISATSRSFAFADDTYKRSEAKTQAQKSSKEVAKNSTENRENSSGSSTIDGARTQNIRKSSAPPLQTLVGPGNFNSANSSVASSLEAPHATRHGSNKHNFSREDDVGYHLLKVCERLSGDMNIFMARRALALSTRRRERGALLSSLQETVQSIWVGKCHVEMYGSCATQLDLPASDLDVVVCGLDRSDDHSQSVGEELAEARSHSPTSLSSEAQAYANQFYPPLSANGTRVIRLATELERIPWAVQVKAIPTASVPVIKILADPSRLPGAAGMDWMLHQQQMAAAAVAAAEMNLRKMTPPQQSIEGCDNSSPQCNEAFNNGHINHHIAAMSGLPANTPSYHSVHPPWRGADVMNGLLSLDITFEGPEHGGLGSTAFSARIVQEACNETGLPPESTPAVQVLMIIKEMLAQRRLNEPFSGGLSSYAILLLVAAVVKERRIIRKEIERVEKQRQAVERSAVDDEVTENSRVQQGAKKVVWPVEKHIKKVSKHSSWASIAMNPSSNNPPDESPERSLDDSTCTSKITNEAFPRPAKVDVASSAKSTINDAQTESLKDSTLFPQGSNDVLEVLCSGEPTAGKLLMHFLLFYGRHFDANTTCIDVSGSHQSDNKNRDQSSPFTPRKAGGSYNPVTDVYTVDPLIVYDPLEGSESNNVARSCYAWGNIRWTFEQCYNTLSGAVELGADSSSNRTRSKTWPTQENVGLPVDNIDASRHLDEPLLELLLSF